MAVDDLVAQHVDARLPPSRWRLTLPAAGSGDPLQHLTEEQLLEVRDPSPSSRKSSKNSNFLETQDGLPPAVAGSGGALRHLTEEQLVSVLQSRSCTIPIGDKRVQRRYFKKSSLIFVFLFCFF